MQIEKMFTQIHTNCILNNCLRKCQNFFFVRSLGKLAKSKRLKRTTERDSRVASGTVTYTRLFNKLIFFKVLQSFKQITYHGNF